MTEFYWQHIDPLWAGAATFVMLLGIGLIYRSWRWHKRAGLVPGWLLLLMSLVGWSFAGTTWIGLPTGFSLLMLIALGWILVQGQWPTQAANAADNAGTHRGETQQNNGNTGSDNTSQVTAAEFPTVRPAALKRGVLRLLLAGPLAAVFALSVGVILAQLFTDTEPGRVLVLELSVSLLWTLGMAWVCLSNVLRRLAIILAGSSVAAIAILSLI